MPTVANMTFPLELAVATAREAAPSTADDMGYVVKTVSYTHLTLPTTPYV